jgi:ubiquinone/menaquinone biosynthesis C-methylase UbiE
MYIDKNDIISQFPKGELVLELGCGDEKRHVNAIGVDTRDFPGVDIVGDVFTVLADLPDRSVKAVYAYHFIEHVNDLGSLLKEIVRVCRIDGIIELSAPHFSNPFFYSDPTHKNTFGLYTFAYFFENELFRRPIPDYSRISSATLVSVDLVFKSYRPNYFRHVLKKIFSRIVNLSPWTQELYEEMGSSVFSCYEVVYLVKKVS